MLERLLNGLLDSLVNRILDYLVKMLLLLSRLLVSNPHASMINNDRKLVWAEGTNANFLIVKSKAGSEEDTSRSSGISNVQGFAAVSSPAKKKENNCQFHKILVG